MDHRGVTATARVSMARQLHSGAAAGIQETIIASQAESTLASDMANSEVAECVRRACAGACLPEGQQSGTAGTGRWDGGLLVLQTARGGCQDGWVERPSNSRTQSSDVHADGSLRHQDVRAGEHDGKYMLSVG